MATITKLGRVGLALKGEYSASTQYYKLDVVTYNGSSYAAKQNTKGNAPPNTAYWQALADASGAATAAAAANSATASANTATSNADAATNKANAAANKADAAANRLSDVELGVTILPPSAEPTASVTQSATKTTFALGIPASNLAYATFEVNDGMNLLMHSPERFSDIAFILNNGNLEMQI